MARSMALATLQGSSAPIKIRHAILSPLHVNDARAISEIGAGMLMVAGALDC
jgi:hypothetical protein